MSIGSEPDFQRNSKSLRQCPSWETMSSVRIRSVAVWIRHDMWNASATQEKSRSSSAVGRPGGGTEKCTRMKNSPPSGSPYCWLLMMFAECCTRKLETAYTIPGLSGQDSVRMNSRPVPSDLLIYPTIQGTLSTD